MKILSPVEVLVRFGKALADPTRAAILLELKKAAAFPTDLAEQIGISRKILSNHLACLQDCGLVAAESEGRRVRYQLTDPKVAHALGDLLGAILSVDAICSCDVPAYDHDKPDVTEPSTFQIETPAPRDQEGLHH